MFNPERGVVMKRRKSLLGAAVIAAMPGMAQAHYSQRVWSDISNSGQLMPVVGPPGNAPFNYNQVMFFYGRVYARDFGSQGDVNYTSLLGGPLFSDLDVADEGVNYQADFPGYENTPYATAAFPADTTYNVSIAGKPLYYVPASGTLSAKFVPVATAFPGQMGIDPATGGTVQFPFFTISNSYVSNGNFLTAQMDSFGNGDPSVPAFTTGSHAHPELTLFPNPDDGSDPPDTPGTDPTDQDQYDGIYAIPLQLSGQGVANSPVFYEVIGKNEPLAEIDAAGIVAENTLVPPTTSQWTLTTSGSWGSISSWSAAMPFYTGDSAIFSTNAGPSSNINVTLDGNYSVGHLLFNSSTTRYTISQGSGGMLSIGSDNGADITVLAGQHTISAPVTFAVALTANISSGSSLTLSGGFSFPPAASYPYPSLLTKSGAGTFSLTGPLSAGYASTFNATGGTTIFSTDPTAGVSIFAIGTSTTIQFTAAASGGYQSRNTASLNISSGASVSLQSPTKQINRTVLDMGSIAIDSTSVLDLGSNDAVIQNADASSAAITLAAVTHWLHQGFNDGRWNGTAGIVSSAAATNTSHLTAIGVIINDGGSGNPIYSSFDATADTDPDTDVLLKYTYYGDANLDGHVDGSDYSRIDNGYLNHLTGWANGDFNYDGVVNGSDYTLIDNAFNSQGASLGDGITTAIVAAPTEQIAPPISPVPEPAAIPLILLVGEILSSRRKRMVSFSSAGGEEEDNAVKK
jgi:hypothetical protein